MLYEAIVPEARQAGYFVVVVDYESVSRIEVGIAATEGEIKRVGSSTEARCRATAFETRGIVDRVPPGVGGLEHQSMGKPLLQLNLKRVVVGNTLTALRANACKDISGSEFGMARVKDGLNHAIGNASWGGRALGCAG